MTIYIATIKVRLEEDSPQAAQKLAQDVANLINDESFTDCASVASVEPN